MDERILITVLMVKNETCVIEATLQPFVDGGVKDFVIFDTGPLMEHKKLFLSFFKRQNNLCFAQVSDQIHGG